MKVENIKSTDDIERYIEGCLNDFESAISTKEETLVYIAELVVYIYKQAKKEQLMLGGVVGRSEQCSGCDWLTIDYKLRKCIKCQKYENME